MEPRGQKIGRRYPGATAEEPQCFGDFYDLSRSSTARVPEASEIGKVLVIGRVALLGAKHRD
jgi:hypothetical protein